MRKKLELIFIIIIVGINIYLFFFDIDLMIEWNTYIPCFNNISYTKLNDPSLRIFTKKYSILHYNSNLKKMLVRSKNWKKLDAYMYEEYLKDIIDTLDWLEVPIEKRPSYKNDFVYIYKKGKDNNYLFMIYSDKEGILYIIEES